MQFPVFFREGQATPSRGGEGEPLEVFLLQHPTSASSLQASECQPPQHTGASTPRVPQRGGGQRLPCTGTSLQTLPGGLRWCGRGGRGDAAWRRPFHKGLSVCGGLAPRLSPVPVSAPAARAALIPRPVKGAFVRQRRWLAPDTGSHAALFALVAARARRICSRATILLPGLAPLGREGHPCPQPVAGP